MVITHKDYFCQATYSNVDLGLELQNVKMHRSKLCVAAFAKYSGFLTFCTVKLDPL